MKMGLHIEENLGKDLMYLDYIENTLKNDFTITYKIPSKIDWIKMTSIFERYNCITVRLPCPIPRGWRLIGNKLYPGLRSKSSNLRPLLPFISNCYIFIPQINNCMEFVEIKDGVISSMLFKKYECVTLDKIMTNYNNKLVE